MLRAKHCFWLSHNVIRTSFQIEHVVLLFFNVNVIDTDLNRSDKKKKTMTLLFYMIHRIKKINRID